MNSCRLSTSPSFRLCVAMFNDGYAAGDGCDAPPLVSDSSLSDDRCMNAR